LDTIILQQSVLFEFTCHILAMYLVTWCINSQYGRVWENWWVSSQYCQ